MLLVNEELDYQLSLQIEDFRLKIRVVVLRLWYRFKS